jgi:putative signal transducing protein
VGDMSPAGLVEIRRVSGRPNAEMIRSLLEAHGVPCVLFGGRDPAYPLTVGPMAEVRIMVNVEDADRAEALIDAAAEGTLELDQ